MSFDWDVIHTATDKLADDTQRSRLGCSPDPIRRRPGLGDHVRPQGRRSARAAPFKGTATPNRTGGWLITIPSMGPNDEAITQTANVRGRSKGLPSLRSPRRTAGPRKSSTSTSNSSSRRGAVPATPQNVGQRGVFRTVSSSLTPGRPAGTPTAPRRPFCRTFRGIPLSAPRGCLQDRQDR